MSIDTKELRRLAELATPGPWHHREHGSHIVDDAPGSQCALVATVALNTYKDRGRHNAAFIVAANPATVISLLDEIDRLRAELDAAHAQLASRGGVPAEPTLDMVQSGLEVYGLEDCAEADVRAIYSAMLAAAPSPEGQEAEQTYKHWCIELVAALKALSFAAQTTGGTAGRDEPLCVAIEQAERAMSYAAASRAIDAARPTPAEVQAGEREALTLAANRLQRIALDLVEPLRSEVSEWAQEALASRQQEKGNE